MHRPYALLAASKTVLLGLVYGRSNRLSNTSNFNHFSICCVSCEDAQVFWQVAAQNKYLSQVASHCLAFLFRIPVDWGDRAFGEDVAVAGKSLYCTASCICSSHPTRGWQKVSKKNICNHKQAECLKKKKSSDYHFKQTENLKYSFPERLCTRCAFCATCDESIMH